MKNILYISLSLLSLSAFAQNKAEKEALKAMSNSKKYTYEGNTALKSDKPIQAEVEYRKAMSQNGSNAHAVYNLGNALMMQQKDSAAIAQLENAGKMETNKTRKAMAYHNIGTICQRHQLYGDVIKAYQEALRNNPNDNETRYNLALCKRLNKNNKNQQKQQKQQKQEQEQQKQHKEKEKQQPKPKEQMSKENAEQLLNATIQDEKATQQRLKKAMQQPSRRTVEKNW